MVYAAVSVSVRQKGDTLKCHTSRPLNPWLEMCDILDSKGDYFRVTDRVLIGPFDITAVSQYLWA